MNTLDIIAAGIIATGLTDLWQLGLQRFGDLPIANWRMVGRWVGSMPHGVFAHDTISDAPAISGEHAIGWMFHYLVGISYAALYALIANALGADSVNLASTLLFGVVTVAAPWFVLQPALGLGVFASRLPNCRSVFFVTMTSHLVFGAGLYAGFRSAQLAL